MRHQAHVFEQSAYHGMHQPVVNTGVWINTLTAFARFGGCRKTAMEVLGQIEDAIPELEPSCDIIRATFLWEGNMENNLIKRTRIRNVDAIVTRLNKLASL